LGFAIAVSDASPAVNGPGGPRRPGIRVPAGNGRGTWIGVAPFLIYVLIFLGLPLYSVFHGALTTDAGHFTLQNFSSSFKSTADTTAIKNSLLIGISTAALGAVFGTWLAAAVLAGRPGGMVQRVVSSASGVLAYFAGVPLAFAWIATLGATGVATALLKHIGINLYGGSFTIASLLGLALTYTYFQIPLMVILITPALEGLRPQWEEAAQSLGASKLSYMRHVAIPVLTPAFVGATLILFGNAFSAYATALALTGGTIALIPTQINEALNGNVIVNGDRVGLALGVEMIVVVAFVMVGYWMVQTRARRWLQ
jgi:putative spermidine/putrescine transport system permease protein